LQPVDRTVNWLSLRV